jgi:hypothetical protein
VLRDAPQLLSGPVFWVLTGLLFVAAMLAAFVTIDSARRAWVPGSGAAEPLRWWYLVPQAVYFVLVILGGVGAIPMIVTGIVFLCMPLALAQGIAYLLRVVFPKTPTTDPAEESMEILADGGDTIEPEGPPAQLS